MLKKPSAKTKKFIELAEKYGAHNYHPLPVVISKARGVWVWDPDGNKYMDMLSSYSAISQGHVHPKIVAAVKSQLSKVTLTSRAFHNDQIGLFLKKAVELCGMEVALPMNTGAEAVETALKMARKWGYKKKGVPDGKAEIIACENNFHGRTTMIVGFSSDAQYRDGFGPFTPGFKLIPFGDLDALRNAITDNTVAFLVEPIQAEAGILMPPEGYLKGVRKLCREKNVLFLCDEIQTGLARTGKMFAWQHEGEEAKPDAIILGKALGGGVIPVSLVVSRWDIMDVFHPGDHGSTFGGNPLACAAGIAAIDVLVKEKLTAASAKMGQYFMKQIRSLNSKHVKEVRGRGLLIGVEVKPESGKARLFCEALMQNGILCKETHESVIRFAPPLVIKKQEIDWAVARVAEVLCA